MQQMEICVNCGTSYAESDYASLARFIMRQKPACSLSCNIALGQVLNRPKGGE